MSSEKVVRQLLFERYMTKTELAKRLTEATGKKYTRQSLSKKITRSAIKYDEMEQIAKILEFKIEIVDLLNTEK